MSDEIQLDEITPSAPEEISVSSDDPVQPFLFRGQIEGTVMSPETPDQVARMLAESAQKKKPISLTHTEAGFMENPIWLNLAKLNGVKKYRKDDLTITVESGITMGRLQSVIQQEGHTYPFHYPKDMLLADVLAEEKPSLEAGLCGLVRDTVLGLEIATPDGALSHWGGDVVKNVSGYDLGKLYVGSFHNLGVITAATLKLSALPESGESFLYEFAEDFIAFECADSLLNSHLPLTRCELFRHGDAKHWQLLATLSGEKSWLVHSMAILQESSALNEGGHSLTPKQEQTIVDFLLDRSAESLAVKIALPWGHYKEASPVFEEILASLPRPTLTQIRPAAGLFYFVWDESRLPEKEALAAVLPALSKAAEARDGFVQMSLFPVSFFDLSKTVNLSKNQILYDWMKKLKYAYDPENVLFSPRLPLGVLRTQLQKK